MPRIEATVKRDVCGRDGFRLKGNVEKGIEDVLIQDSVCEQNGGEDHQHDGYTAGNGESSLLQGAEEAHQARPNGGARKFFSVFIYRFHLLPRIPYQRSEEG